MERSSHDAAWLIQRRGAADCAHSRSARRLGGVVVTKSKLLACCLADSLSGAFRVMLNVGLM